MKRLVGILAAISCLSIPLAHGEYSYHGVIGERSYQDQALFPMMERILHIDVDSPLEDETGQIYQAAAMLGREDLIHPESSIATVCEAITQDTDDLLNHIIENARRTSVVIINEAHDMPLHRAFIEDVLKVLSEEGYFIYAAEAFSHADLGEMPGDVRLNKEQPFIRDSTGYYTKEPTFAQTMRTAKSLGYDLVPYEIYGDQLPETDAPFEERITARELDQARNLMTNVIEHYANPKVLIHAGYNHAAEAPHRSGAPTMMAQYFKEMSGIDPLTIDQTHCTGTSETRLTQPAPGYSASFDITIAHPVPTFTRGRPTWRRTNGERNVEIIDELLPAEQALVVEAHYFDEPYDAVPVDRIFIRPSENLPLILPPGRYKVSAVYLDNKSSEAYELVVR